MDPITWKFRLSEPTLGISQISLQEHTDYWDSQDQFWFYGYKPAKEIKATLFGKKVGLTFEITPKQAPIQQMPTAQKFSTPNRSLLTPERELQLTELEARLQALQDRIPGPITDERIFEKYIDLKRFVGSFQQMINVWNNPNIELTAKLPQVIPFLLDIYDTFKEVQLPDELMRDDTKFFVALARMLQYVEIIEENATIHKHPFPPEITKLKELLDQLTDQMAEGGDRLFGTPNPVSDEVYQLFIEKKIIAQHRDQLTIDERLPMLEELIESPCANRNDKMDLLKDAIQFILKETQKKLKTPCPHKELIIKHLEEIRIQLKEIDDAGISVWQLRIAEELLESANSWRESELPILSKETFASMIFLEGIHIETKEGENGEINSKIDLYFQDEEDSFTGHSIYVSVKNGSINEITIVG